MWGIFAHLRNEPSFQQFDRVATLQNPRADHLVVLLDGQPPDRLVRDGPSFLEGKRLVRIMVESGVSFWGQH